MARSGTSTSVFFSVSISTNVKGISAMRFAPVLLCTVLLCCAMSALAGEQPKLHLTGNPTVDFFGTISLSNTIIGRDTNMPGPDRFHPPLSEGSEKSPWLAGVLSLAIPGAGEMYTDNHLKGAIFFGIEVASWAVAYTYNKKGNDQTDLFENFANLHWNAVQYANWSIENSGQINPNAPHDAAYYEEQIFDGRAHDNPGAYGPPFSVINWSALNVMETEIANNGYTHQLPYWNQQQYYELIGKYAQFFSGWDDADLSSLSMPVNESKKSKNMLAYAEMRAQANNYFDVASTFVSVAILNHIVSALDAFWSATRYNSSLHASLRVRPIPTQFGIVPMTEANIRYDF
jgi:hypothetical protein